MIYLYLHIYWSLLETIRKINLCEISVRLKQNIVITIYFIFIIIISLHLYWPRPSFSVTYLALTTTELTSLLQRRSSFQRTCNVWSTQQAGEAVAFNSSVMCAVYQTGGRRSSFQYLCDVCSTQQMGDAEVFTASVTCAVPNRRETR